MNKWVTVCLLVNSTVLYRLVKALPRLAMLIAACSVHSSPTTHTAFLGGSATTLSPTAYGAVFTPQGPVSNLTDAIRLEHLTQILCEDELDKSYSFPLFQELEMRHTEGNASWWWIGHKEHLWCEEKHSRQSRARSGYEAYKLSIERRE